MKPHFGLAVTPSIHLVRPLGRGGMGSVWVAEHRALKTEVAVKFLSGELLEREGAIARFSQEATAAAQIQSPHGVHIYDHGVLDEELPFIVMELLQGEDLGARIQRLGPLHLSEVSALFLQLSRVLKKAHELGIVHRDIKPENIMVLRDYGDFFVKLIDFGIAKVMGGGTGMTATGAVIGTPDYMCPEQFYSAKDVGPGADLWSLAAVMYHALTGERPFPGETLPAVIFAVEKGKFRLPYRSGQIGNPAVDAFFQKALAREPSDRFGSLDEMAEAWQLAAKESPTHVPASEDLTATPTRDDRPGPSRRDEYAQALGSRTEKKGTLAFPPEPALSTSPSEVEIAEVESTRTSPQGESSPTVGALPHNIRPAQGGRIPSWTWLVLVGAAAALIAAVSLTGGGGDAIDSSADAGQNSEKADGPKTAAAFAVDSQKEAPPPPALPPVSSAAPLTNETLKAPSAPRKENAPQIAAPLSQPVPAPAKPVAPKSAPAPAKPVAPKSAPAPQPAPALKDRGF